ncbi:MAG: hypothetical protein JWN29_3413 [Acidimicrobiales bacterium]|nr:hypothetical protein [Acidimicrobiales bacterium]
MPSLWHAPGMPVPEAVLTTIHRFCEEQTPPEHRQQMRLEATIRGNSVTIAECRPPWDGTSGEWIRQPVAQLRYEPDSGRWSLHWADRNSRWHPYDDLGPTKDVGRILAEVERDPTCIFFG